MSLNLVRYIDSDNTIEQLEPDLVCSLKGNTGSELLIICAQTSRFRYRLTTTCSMFKPEILLDRNSIILRSCKSPRSMCTAEVLSVGK